MKGPASAWDMVHPYSCQARPVSSAHSCPQCPTEELADLRFEPRPAWLEQLRSPSLEPGAELGPGKLSIRPRMSCISASNYRSLKHCPRQVLKDSSLVAPALQPATDASEGWGFQVSMEA